MAIGRLLFTSIPRALKSLLVFGFCLSIAASVVFAVSLQVRLDETYHLALQTGGPLLGGLLLFLVVNRKVRSAEGFVSLMVVSLLVAGASQAFAYYWPREMHLPAEKLELCPPAGSSAGLPVEGEAAGCSP